MSASRETLSALAVSSEAEKADVLDELVAIDHELQDRGERVARSRLSDVETDGVASAVTTPLLALYQEDLAANAGRTRYQAAAGTVHAESGQSAMPVSLLPASPHTHHALDDAIEQGELFANVFEWVARRRHTVVHAPRSVASQAPAWLVNRVGSAR